MGFTLSTSRQEGICGDVAAAGYRLDVLFYWFHMRILKFLVTDKRNSRGSAYTKHPQTHAHTVYILLCTLGILRESWAL